MAATPQFWEATKPAVLKMDKFGTARIWNDAVSPAFIIWADPSAGPIVRTPLATLVSGLIVAQKID